jgi:hypothetical protein
MQTPHYTFWENKALQEMGLQDRKEPGDGTTMEGLRRANAINSNTYMTPEEKYTALQALNQQVLKDAAGKPILDKDGNPQPVIGPKILDEYLGWAKEPTHMNNDVREAYDRITKWTTNVAAKFGPDTDYKQVALVSNALRQFGQALQELRRSGHTPTKDEIDAKAADIMRGAYQPPGQGAPAVIHYDRPGDVEAIFRATQQRGTIPNATTKAAIQEFGTRNIPEVYGAGVKARAIGFEPVNRDTKTWGSPIYEVTGLREAPTLPFYMRYGMDDSGRMSLQVLDGRGNWVPPTDLTTLAQHNATQAIASSKMLQATAAGKAEEHAQAFKASNLPKLTEVQMQQFEDAINIGAKPKDIPDLAKHLSSSFGLEITAADIEREGVSRGYWK